MDLEKLKKSAEERQIPIIKEDTEKLLRMLVHLKQPQKILEIGTAVGYSGSVMLSCGTDSKLYTIEIDEDRYLEARENFASMGYFERVTAYLGDAREIVESITGSYDFIFVDGPKGQYIYFLPILYKLLSKGGVLVCDNVMYRGLVDGSTQMRRKNLTLVTNLRNFLDKINGDSTLETCVFDNIGDGVSVSIKINAKTER